MPFEAIVALRRERSTKPRTVRRLWNPGPSGSPCSAASGSGRPARSPRLRAAAPRALWENASPRALAGGDGWGIHHGLDLGLGRGGHRGLGGRRRRALDLGVEKVGGQGKTGFASSMAPPRPTRSGLSSSTCAGILTAAESKQGCTRRSAVSRSSPFCAGTATSPAAKRCGSYSRPKLAAMLGSFGISWRIGRLIQEIKAAFAGKSGWTPVSKSTQWLGRI